MGLFMLLLLFNPIVFLMLLGFGDEDE